MFNLLEQKHNGSSAITGLSENPYKIPWGGGVSHRSIFATYYGVCLFWGFFSMCGHLCPYGAFFPLNISFPYIQYFGGGTTCNNLSLTLSPLTSHLSPLTSHPSLLTPHSPIPQVQLGPRYEGQLNLMAEPIPHEVRPLVRTQVYHPYHAADRQAETDS